MNVIESWVRVEDYRVPLIGGEAACVFLDPGAHDVLVTSVSIATFKPANTRACKSPVLHLQLAVKEDRSFWIWPAKKGGEFVCGWRMESQDPPANAP